MPEPFTLTMRARWSDMDFNQHMGNAAYLGCAGQTRMEFLDANGWPMSQFTQLGLGPVVLEDRLVYRRELPLLAEFRVGIEIAASKPDFRRMKIRNRFTIAADGAECAVVDSVVLWFDLAARKPVAPPEALRAVWRLLPQTQDYESW